MTYGSSKSNGLDLENRRYAVRVLDIDKIQVASQAEYDKDLLSCPSYDATCRQGNCAEERTLHGSIGNRAVLRLHFVVLKNDRYRVFALLVNVRRFFHDNEILVVDGSWGTQDRFDLFFRHPLGHFIDVRLGDSFARSARAQTYQTHC